MEASPRQETESAQQVASSRKFPRHIRAFLKDGRGRYWLGGIPNLLYRFDDMASVWKAPVILRIEGPSTPHLDLLPLAQNTPAGISSGNPHVNVMCIIETNDGSVWFGTGNEGETAHGFVCRVDGDSYQSLLTRHQLVVNIVEDQMGRLWLGGWRDGFISVYCPDEDGILKEENLTTFELDNEAARKAVLSLAIDAQGAVLVAYPQGIYRFDPVEEVTIRVTEQLGLPEIWYSAVACTDDGHLWFGTGAAGVYRTDGKHIQQLTEADGLPGNSITRLSPLNNGAIAIGTSRGMAIYTPMATTAPGIEIREVTADTVYTSPDDIVLTHGEMGPVSFSYHGRSFATRRMRYRYTLEGHEDTWHDTWDTLAQYENLKPGEYTFKVIGINRDLIRSPRPATLSLTILENTREQRIAELEHQTSKLEAENIYLQEEIRGQHNFEAIISSGSTLNAVLRQVEQVAATDATVLILGETGTGKELIARAVHHLSSRNEHALVKVNCAALPSGLIESELFGHEQGAFTGALSRKTGRFELADGGTIFLDEIGDLPLELQAKLLRVLQDGEFERLGNPKTMKVDVRIMAATNRDLAEEIERGRFREDLFYRLNVVPLTMPPLRDRKEDISVLVSHFVRQFCAQVGKEIDTIPIHLMERLNSYNWPGNVRELENIVERAVILSSGRELDIGDWLPVPAPEVVSNDTETLKAREKTHILEALRQTEWRVSGSRGAARILGLKPTTLEARMKKLGIKRPV
ncbi:MAG: sigma 54-interacting transcriptional regulator [Candidatus Latescibacteria bacterium]|nr:sigma 54-interacting transcriptional regulator [Candidatus Latescibacterota bacterium]